MLPGYKLQGVRFQLSRQINYTNYVSKAINFIKMFSPFPLREAECLLRDKARVILFRYINNKIGDLDDNAHFDRKQSCNVCPALHPRWQTQRVSPYKNQQHKLLSDRSRSSQNPSLQTMNSVRTPTKVSWAYQPQNKEVCLIHILAERPINTSFF